MMKCRAIQNTQMEKYSMKRLVKMVEKMKQFLSREHASFSGGVSKSMLTLNEAIFDVKEG